MTISIPTDKTVILQENINTVLQAKKVTLKQMQTLLGLLNFACRVVAQGRAFCRRLINSTIGIKKHHHKIRITQNIKLDLLVWKTFLKDYNGVSVINTPLVDSHTVQLFTDSAEGEWGGFGIYFGGKWAGGQWPQHWGSEGTLRDMTFLELFPALVALTLYNKYLQNTRLLFHIDNMSVVHIINNSTSKSDRVMNIVRKLTLQYNIQIKASYIPTKANSIADAISRSQWARFRHFAPEADFFPTPVPNHVWDI
ncbi:uncharacterized protein LOC134230935 [Saccostrea cucullata]|uniref:uncharacterized protein LOC134230935 n=1 Tax=Saccostrea cuccullata TaxID=36930 RepID=UPI002ED65EC0